MAKYVIDKEDIVHGIEHDAVTECSCVIYAIHACNAPTINIGAHVQDGILGPESRKSG
jgi:hypothetical protein